MPSRPRALILATLMVLTAVPIGAADFLGAFTWDRDRSDHGGFSAIEVSADGGGFVALTDKSVLVTGRLLRTAERITGVKVEQTVRLRTLDGAPMRGTYGDSEGLAVRPDGGLHVSFENEPRVWFYPSAAQRPRALPTHPAFPELPENGALEALAVDADGALYTMPERAEGDLPFPVWRFDGSDWNRAFSLPSGGYAIVGVDFDDRGRLYLLERKFRGIGFASRVRRITLRDGGVAADDVLLETSLRDHDNLEGISIWRDAGGTLRATMISDDNFNWLQRTEIVEYRLPD